MRMASSTARWLSTGSEPGRPRHTGQMLVLGSSPKALGQPQNSLVAVCSSQWTSRPMTVSQPRRLTTGAPVGQRRGRGRAAGAARLDDRGHLEQGALAQRRGEHLHPDGQPVVAGAEGDADGRVPGQVGRDGAHVGQVHGQRVVDLGPEGEGGGRAWWRRAARRSAGRRRSKPSMMQRAHLLGLAVVGVVVAGRQRVGAEHDPPLHLGAEARPRGWRCSWPRRRRRRPAGRSGPRRSGPGWTRPRPGRSGSRPTGRSATSGTEHLLDLGPGRGQGLGRLAHPGRHVGVDPVDQLGDDARPAARPRRRRAPTATAAAGRSSEVESQRVVAADDVEQQRRRRPPWWRTGPIWSSELAKATSP